MVLDWGCMKMLQNRKTRDSLCRWKSFLKLLHKLIFNLASTVAGKYIDTPTFKKFLKCDDAAFEISQGFVDKEMKELKEMEDKRINSSNAFQGVYTREQHVPVCKRQSTPLSTPSPPPLFPFLGRVADLIKYCVFWISCCVLNKSDFGVLL